LCELIFELYAYRFKFTGEGVLMHKKKDGGIACRKVAKVGLAGPQTGPPGGRPDQPGGAAGVVFCFGFRRGAGSARRSRRTSGEKSGPAGLSAGASGPEAGAAGLIVGIAAVCSLQRPDSHLPINTPSPSLGRVRTSPTIVHP
jgi:hypothetical protein